MTDDTFEELINLHLDGEISPAEQAHLNAEINRSLERACQFHKACRLHEALQMVLDPEALHPKDLNAPLPWLRIFLSGGVAACFMLAAVILVPVLMMDGSTGTIAVETESAVESINLSQAERLTAQQGAMQPTQSSLAAQLRLQGLQPELTPQNRQLQVVKSSAVVRRRVILLNSSESGQQDLQMLAVAKETAIEPTPKFEIYSDFSRPAANKGSGFQVSLINFK